MCMLVKMPHVFLQVPHILPLTPAQPPMEGSLSLPPSHTDTHIQTHPFSPHHQAPHPGAEGAGAHLAGPAHTLCLKYL